MRAGTGEMGGEVGGGPDGAAVAGGARWRRCGAQMV